MKNKYEENMAFVCKEHCEIIYEHVCVPALAQVVLRPEEDTESPGAGVTGGYKPPSQGAGNKTLRLLQEQKVL